MPSRRTRIQNDKLIARARDAAAHAYAPYSGFSVGAALETRDGRVFVGTNMENASYGLAMCAEVGALTAATAAGALTDIVRIAVVGGRPGPDGALTGTDPVRPCGRCRQLISEAAQLGGIDIDVVCSSGDGNAIDTAPISELLPRAFGPRDLGMA